MMATWAQCTCNFGLVLIAAGEKVIAAQSGEKCSKILQNHPEVLLQAQRPTMTSKMEVIRGQRGDVFSC